MAVLTGTISRLFLEKGFGFIKSPGAADEYFFHANALGAQGTFEQLREGLPVTFEEEPSTGRGPRARHVMVDQR